MSNVDLRSLFDLPALLRWFSRLSAMPSTWTGASSEIAQAGFHARYQASVHAGMHVPRSG